MNQISMKSPDYINLERTFKALSKKNSNDSFHLDNFSFINTPTKSDLTWENLLDQRLCVVLAEAGSGKTSEFEAQVERLKEEGKKAFFIRIEDITSPTAIFGSFHVEIEVERWLDTLDNGTASEKAYFFLDAVDEARLKDPNAFFNALNVFARKIYKGFKHCSIFISSRPCSWKYEEDEREIKKIFIDSSFSVYVLQPLSPKKIITFCETLGVKNYSTFLKEVNSSNLISLASRPFDLINMLNIWKIKGVIESRSQLIQDSIELKLQDNPRRTETTFKQRICYAKRLAASTLLTGNSAIKQMGHIEEGVLIAQDVMKDCTPQQIQEVLSCAIFGDILYEKVRFRHREIRDYLAAKWFQECLMKNQREVEKLLFPTVFQEQVIPQLYVTILPWLALFDNNICQKVIQVRPEILLENGDSASLSLDCQKLLIFKIVNRIENNTDLSKLTNFLQNVYVIRPELDNYIAEIISQHSIKDNEPITLESSRVLNFLIQLVAQENLPNSLNLTSKIALDEQYDDNLRAEALGSALISGSVEDSLLLWSKLNTYRTLSRQFLIKILNFSLQQVTDREELITKLLLTTFSIVKIDDFSEFSYTVHDLLKEYVDCLNDTQIYLFLRGLNKLAIEDIDTYFTPKKIFEAQPKLVSSRYWLVPIILYIIKGFVTKKSHLSLDIETFKALFTISANFYHPDFEWKAKHDTRKSVDEIKIQFSKQKDLKLNFVKRFIDLFAPEGLNFSFEEKSVLFSKFVGCDSCNFRREGRSDDQNNFMDAFEYAQDTKNRILVRHFFLSIAIKTYDESNYCNKRKGQLEALIESEASFQDFKKWLKPFDAERFANSVSEETKNIIAQREKVKKERQAAVEEILKTITEDPSLILMTGSTLTSLQKRLISLVESMANSKAVHYYNDCSNWKALEEKTNPVVAENYKKLLRAFWRKNKVFIEGNSSSHLYFIGLSGLNIEFDEEPNFLDDEVVLAIKYAVLYQPNEFPVWFKRLYLAYPKLFTQTICSYLEDEQERHLNLFFKISIQSPWLHLAISPKLIEFLENNFQTLDHSEILYSISILAKRSDCLERLTILINKIATDRTQSSRPKAEKAFGYALLFESSPTNTVVDQFRSWLNSLSKDNATEFVKTFLKVLMDWVPTLFNCLTPDKPINVLKELYVLVCKYYPLNEEDIRQPLNAYFLREHEPIQAARDKIFRIISASKTKSGFHALKDLANLPNTHKDRRTWLNGLAYDIATECGSHELFSAKDIVPFEEKTIFQPRSVKEVYSTVISTMEDIKDHIEKGNISAYKVWQKVCDEEEMRNLIAEQLYFRLKQFFTAQEYELANEQRLDLQVNYYNVKGSIPIELKMAQRWSGNEFLRHLENQLIKDYLRHPSSPYGIFLIINVADKGQESWKINGKSVSVIELQETLQQFADNLISTKYSDENAQGVKVIVIDTLVRGTKFNN